MVRFKKFKKWSTNNTLKFAQKRYTKFTHRCYSKLTRNCHSKIDPQILPKNLPTSVTQKVMHKS